MSRREHKQNYLSTTNTTSTKTFLGAGNFSYLKIPLLFLCLLTLAVSASANTHTSIVTVTPSVVPASVNANITAHVECTSGPDPIHEFRVYEPLEFSGLVCDTVTGWYDPFYAYTTIGGDEYYYCQWNAKFGNQLYEGDTEEFTFSLDTSDTECCRDLFVETRDDYGFYEFHNPLICVDLTAPETTKSFNGPYKIDGSVEWIDGVTTVVLEATDCPGGCSDETGPHDAGIDKTLYLNILAEDHDLGEDPCWNLAACQPMFLSPPTECVLEAELECHYDPQDPNSVDCVENYIYDVCFGGQAPFRWQVYDGTPITKDEESCHLLQYYSIDGVGNTEDVKVNCFFVDKKPPIVDKDNGDAIEGSGEPMFITNDNPDGLFHWITTKMPIELDCTDQAPHPSGDEEMCFKVSYDYPDWHYITEEYCSTGYVNPEGYCCVDVSGEEVYDFYFREESMHNLEYYCIDAVEKDSEVHVQYYKVDDTAPHLVDKWIVGPYHEVQGDCPPNDETDICHLDGESYIDIIVEDGGDICAVDEVLCQWGYTLEDGSFFGWYETFPIQFPEESRHELVIECYDALGNKMVDEETFYVDKTAPETTKEYFGPQYPVEGYPKWITSSTEIELTATDSIGPHDSGVKETNYRVTLVDDFHCWSTGECAGGQGSGDYLPYSGPFQIADESCHMIEYYSVDNVYKVEETKRQCVFVENTEPTVWKEVGEPKVVKNDSIYITKTTPIDLFCEDQGDHPVDHVSLKYRYRISDDCASWGDWTDWIDPNGELVQKTILFPEDSCHELEYYCEDALGNETVHEFEIDIVDTQAPVITKRIDGPSEGDCLPRPGTDDRCYIDGITEIHVDVVDPEPHPVDEVVCEWDYEVIGGDKIGTGQRELTPPFVINFPEESEHVLTITCRDALGNETVDIETFIVDKTPPIIVKE